LRQLTTAVGTEGDIMDYTQRVRMRPQIVGIETRQKLKPRVTVLREPQLKREHVARQRVKSALVGVEFLLAEFERLRLRELPDVPGQLWDPRYRVKSARKRIKELIVELEDLHVADLPVEAGHLDPDHQRLRDQLDRLRPAFELVRAASERPGTGRLPAEFKRLRDEFDLLRPAFECLLVESDRLRYEESVCIRRTTWTKVVVARPGADGGPKVVTSGHLWHAALKVEVQDADGVMVGDRNLQKNYTRLEIRRPVPTFELQGRGAAFERAFNKLVEEPGSRARQAAFRRQLKAPGKQRHRARVHFGTCAGRARVSSCAVRIQSSRGVCVGSGNQQVNRYRYRLERPRVPLDTLLRLHPGLARRFTEFVAHPTETARESAFMNEVARAHAASAEYLYLFDSGSAVVPARTAGVIIGNRNRQRNTSRAHVWGLDKSPFAGHIRTEVLERHHAVEGGHDTPPPTP
jgi:hypothetical protein